jgi:hypothetical protein
VHGPHAETGLQQQFEDHAAVIGFACGKECLQLMTVVDFDFLFRVMASSEAIERKASMSLW